MNQLRQDIERYFSSKEVEEGLKKTVSEVFSLINSGELRICQKENGKWIVNQWVKKAILMSFKVNDNSIFSSGMSNSRRGQYTWFDKVNLKTYGWV